VKKFIILLALAVCISGCGPYNEPITHKLAEILNNKLDEWIQESTKSIGNERPTIKGNSFDGLEIGAYKTEAEGFIEFVNNIINKNKQLKERIISLEEAEHKLNCLESFGVDNWCGYDEAMQMMRECE